MPKSIDERIVDMKFNNKQFEKGVNSTIKTINELEKSLEFENAGKGFKAIEKASNSADLSGIGKSIDAISGKFSALGVVGFTVIQNLTNSALRLGKRLSSALSVDPLLDGLKEYEIKMNSIQTIVTATSEKGTTMQEITDVLDELNDYADLTIYNFAQMTDNLGKFANAGVDIDKAATAIKGLSNIAAGAGTDATKMAAATYQVSQALSQGYFLARDWMSLEMANMTSPKVRSALVDTAKKMGVVVDVSGGFRDSLKQGWLTSEVFIEAMQEMAEDPALLLAAQNVTTFTKLLDTMKEVLGSGWAKTWENILGGKDQSTQLWTGISKALGDVIDAEADARNELFAFWNEQGGRLDVLVGIGNILTNIAKILEPMEKAFASVFKPITAETLLTASRRFRELTESFKIGDGTAKALERTFAGLFSLVNIGVKTIKLFGKILGALLGAVLPIGDGFLGITALIGDFIVGIDKGIFVIDNIAGAFEGLLDVLSPVINKIVDLFKYMVGGLVFLGGQINLDVIKNEFEYLGKQLKPIAETIRKDLEYLTNKISLDGITATLVEIKDVFVDLVFSGYDLGEMFKNLGNNIITSLQSVKSFIQPLTKVGTFIYGIFMKIGQGIAFVWSKIVGFVDAIKQGFIDTGSNLKDGTIGVFDAIKNALDYLDWDKIEKLLKGSLLASIILVFRKFMNSISTFLAGGGSIFGPIVEALESVKDTLETYQNVLKANILLKIAGAIAILTVSLIALSSIDSDKLKSALIAMGSLIVGLVGGVTAVNKLIDSEGYTEMAKAVTGMVGMAIAVGILASAIKKLAALNVGDLTKGVTAIIALLGSIVLLSKYMDKNITRIGKAAGGLILFSFAVNSLVTAVKRMSKLDWKEMLVGLGGVIGLMAGLVGVLKAGDAAQLSIKSAIALGVISLAISRLTGVVGSLGRLDPGELYRGLAGVIVLLTSVASFMLALDKIGDVSKASIVIFSLSSSIVAIGFALKMIATLSWEELAKGITAMTVTLGLFISAMLALKKTSMSAETSTSMVIMAGSMLLVGYAIQKLGNLDWREIGVGLGVMATTLAIFTAVTKFSKPTDIATGGAMLLMTGALIILGTALEKLGNLQWIQIGKGLTAMLGALTILSAASYVMTANIAGAFAMVVMAGALMLMVPPLLLLSSVDMKGVGAGLALLAGTLVVLGAAAYFLAPLIPVILGIGAGIALIGVGVGIAGAGLALLTAGLVALAGAIFTGGISISFLVEDILPLIPKIVETLGDSIIVGIRKVSEALPELGVLIVKGIQTIADIIVQTTDVVVQAIGDLILNLLRAIDDRLPEFLEVGLSILLNLIEGIANNISEIVGAGADLVVNYIEGIASKIGDIVQAGVDLYVAFVNGIADAIRNNKEVVADAWANVLSAIFGISQEEMELLADDFFGYGADLIMGLIGGIKSLGGKAKNEVVYIGNQIKKGFTSMFGIQSPSKWFNAVGGFLMEGLANGITDGSDEAVKASTDANKDIQKENDKAAASAGDAAKEAFDKAVEWINERKFYNLLTLQEELDEWLKLQKIYAKGSDERKKIDREVYTLREKLAEAEFKRSLDWIDEKKYYNELALTEELAAWKRVQARYDDGQKKHVKAMEERKKADRQVYKIEQELAKLNTKYQNEIVSAQKKANDERIALEEEYYERTKTINDQLKYDIQSITDEYEYAVDSRAKTLYDAYSIFDKVELKDAVEGSELVENLEGQVEALKTWREQINLLKARGISTPLVEELQELGPSAVQEIRALNKLSQAELTRYESLWAEKHREAKNRAVYELTEMREDTAGIIDLLNQDAKTELEEYRRTWARNMLLLAKDSKINLVEIRDEWLKTVGDMRTESEEALLGMMNDMIDVVSKDDWSSIGKNMIDGIVYGATSKESILIDEMAWLAKQMLTGFEDELEIKSPSKAFARLGVYTVEGLIAGIKSMSAKLKDETTNMGKIVKDAINTAIENLNSPGTGQLQPTIKPVVDLSDVESSLNNALGQNRSLNVDASIATANQTKDDVDTRQAAIDNSTQTEVSITNNYTVRDDGDIRRISRDLKDTMDRYSYARGVVVT